MRLVLALVLLLVGSAAWADEPRVTAARDTEATLQEDRSPAVSKRRLTTEERWRGGPYLRSRESDSIRAEALGRALPIERPGVQSSFAIRAAESEALRRQALDMALPYRPLGF